jgi:hypothetical protein
MTSGPRFSLGDDAFLGLFSESASRCLVTVKAHDADALAALARSHGVPLTLLGETGGAALVVDGHFEVSLAELREAWSSTLPTALS